MVRMFALSEKPTTDHQNSNNSQEHTRGYLKRQILKGFPSSNQVVQCLFGMSTQGFCWRVLKVQNPIPHYQYEGEMVDDTYLSQPST